jgi:hypothetical protein
MPDEQHVSIAVWAISIMVPAAAGLGGVFLGGWLSGRNEQRRRQFEFVEKQLRELYSPMLSTRREIRLLSELRERVAAAANDAWQQLCAEAREAGGATQLQKLSQDRWPEFERVIHYDNEQFRTRLLPAYEGMLQLLREKYWLANESTRRHMPALIEYVELWHRHLDRTIPGEVVARLDVREGRLLQALYEELESTFGVLRQELASGVVSRHQKATSEGTRMNDQGRI